MAAPTSRGIGTSLSNTNASGHTSITINTSDMPSGIQTGDRVILHVWIYIAVNNAISVPTWPAGVTARTGYGSTSGGGSNAIYLVDFRYDSSLFPMTISNLGRASTYSQGNIWATAYSPSYSYSGITSGFCGSSTNPAPSSWTSGSFTTSGPGILVADTYYMSGDITGYNPANSFSAIGGYASNIAEYCVASAGTYTLPKWSRTTGSFPGTAVAAFYDIEDPPISTWVPKAVLL